MNLPSEVLEAIEREALTQEDIDVYNQYLIESVKTERKLY